MKKEDSITLTFCPNYFTQEIQGNGWIREMKKRLLEAEFIQIGSDSFLAPSLSKEEIAKFREEMK